MSETMTYDPGTDSVTTEENLTSEEQDSLAVGEEMEAQQNQLLAGKYENAQELEKAYVELQKKLGEDGQDSKAEAESKSEEVLPEESEEGSKETSPAVALVTEASEEYYANEGKLSDETIEKFSSMSSKDLVNAYMDIVKNNLSQLVQAAKKNNNFLRLDMENVPYTSETIRLYKEMFEHYNQIGIVIQAYLHRSLDDIKSLSDEKFNVRICKGIYVEDPKLVLKDYNDIRENYIRLVKEALNKGSYVGIATHDEFLIDNIYSWIIKNNISIVMV